jgi:exosortase
VTLAKRAGVFSLYTVCLAVATSGVCRAVVDLASHDETASHILLVPFVTLALMFQRRQFIFAAVASAPVSGAAAIAAGVALLGVGAVTGGVHGGGASLSVMVAGIVVSWVGGLLMLCGAETIRRALFPLLFLGFAIPIPPSILAAATHVLKTGSAEAVAYLFTLTNTPYHREGFLFSLPTFVVEVADECSGIRSSIALLLTSLLAGHMFLESGWKKAVVAAAVVPLAVLKNGVRIVTLSLLAEHVDPSFLTGRLHHEGGIVFYLFTLAVLAPPFALLCRSDMRLHGAIAQETR